MTLKLISEPGAEPVSLAEARLHLRIDSDVTSEDALITSLIVAARQRAEQETQRALITQTWERVLDAFPASEIKLGRPPVQSISSIKYLDPTTREEVTLDAADYTSDLDNTPGWVLPAWGLTWPIALNDTTNGVRVRFVCGYGAAGTDVPQAIRTWMLLEIGTMYRHREAIAAGVSVAELPGRFHDGMLDRYRFLEP